MSDLYEADALCGQSTRLLIFPSLFEHLETLNNCPRDCLLLIILPADVLVTVTVTKNNLAVMLKPVLSQGHSEVS